MSKASARKSNGDIMHSSGSNNKQSPIEEPSFANGELGQLQEILFGQQQRSTNQQIGLLQEQINEQLLALSVDLHGRMDQMAESLERSRQHVEKQLDSLKKDNQAAQAATKENINSTKADVKREIEALSKSTDEGTERLNAELALHESRLLEELEQTKLALQAEMKGSISSLDSSKLDRENLAKLLGDIAGKLSDPANVR